MDATTTLNLVIAGASVVAAAVAVFQALSARQSRAGAEEALEATKTAAQAAERQAAATERAVRLQEAQSQKDPWLVEEVDDAITACINNTNSPIVLARIAPAIESQHIELDSVNVDGRYAPGESFTVRTGGNRHAYALTLSWRFEGDNRLRSSLLNV